MTSSRPTFSTTPPRTVSTPGEEDSFAPPSRTSARTVCPSEISRLSRCPPTKPVAPVRKTFIRRFYMGGRGQKQNLKTLRDEAATKTPHRRGRRGRRDTQEKQRQRLDFRLLPLRFKVLGLVFIRVGSRSFPAYAFGLVIGLAPEPEV